MAPLFGRAGTDVDLQNRLDGATPLHLAVKLDSPAARQGVIEMLLEAGADPRQAAFELLPIHTRTSELTPPRARHRIKDKHGSDVASYLNPEEVPEDAAIQRAIAISIAEFTVGGVDGGDLASDGDDDGEAGSGSGSDSE